jgi:hypothetical protein
MPDISITSSALVNVGFNTRHLRFIFHHFVKTYYELWFHARRITPLDDILRFCYLEVVITLMHNEEFRRLDLHNSE